jgi:hypothetical protein
VLVNLRACDTVAISLPEAIERRGSVAAVCESLGFSWRLLDGVKASPGWLGCGLSHLLALRQAKPLTPLLILEDDIEATDAFAPVIDVPDDADAVYLGTSLYGAVDIVDYVGFTDMVAADPAGDLLVRVYNLLGTHAILYLSDRFRRASQDMILESMLERGWEHDKGMAKLQESFTVYALRRPMFVQADHLQSAHFAGIQRRKTDVVLGPSTEGASASLGIGDGWRPAVLARDGARLRWCWTGDAG